MQGSSLTTSFNEQIVEWQVLYTEIHRVIYIYDILTFEKE